MILIVRYKTTAKCLGAIFPSNYFTEKMSNHTINITQSSLRIIKLLSEF